jgi:predicted ribosome quality control (RQC) complex YloA/Tae2 family protein
MVQFEHIFDAASEAQEILIGGRIDRVWCVDDYTFLVALRSRSSNLSLILSVLKRSRRFHLVFDPIAKDYLYASVQTDILNRNIKGGRISGLYISDGCLSVEIRREDTYTLFIDFLELNIVLRDSDGGAVFALHRRSIPDGVNTRGLDRSKSSPSALSLNRELGLQFFEERNGWLVKRLSKIVKAEERRAQRLTAKLLEEEEEVEKKDRYRLFGELLKYNLNSIERGAEKVILKNFNGNEVEIALDARLSPVQNMELYFRRYRKLVRKEKLLEERIEAQNQRLEHLGRLHDKIIDGGLVGLQRPLGLLLEEKEFQTLGNALREKLMSAVTRKEKTGQQGEKRAFRRFLSESGKVIIVGRSASENDELIRRVARGNDMWFHSEAASGSHVILQYEKGKEFTEHDIQDASMLALHYSKNKTAGAGEVVYTRCKWVRKPKGAKKGVVLYYNNKTKYVRYDEHVIAKLFQRALAL